MKITKFGHCCLLIEIQGIRIITDPGRFSVGQNEVTGIDLILITHEHTDHFHTDSLNLILQNNPGAKVVTNSSVGKILRKSEIEHQVLEGSSSLVYKEVMLQAYDGKHAEIYEEYGQVQNTGYFIAEQFFYPGDAYTDPGKNVPILALPVSGPWCKVAEALVYALQVKPAKVIPVHDGLLNEYGISVAYGFFEGQLRSNKIDFVPLVLGEEKELL